MPLSDSLVLNSNFISVFQRSNQIISLNFSSSLFNLSFSLAVLLDSSETSRSQTCNPVNGDGPDFQLQHSGPWGWGGRLRPQQHRGWWRLTLEMLILCVGAGAALPVGALNTVHFNEWGTCQHSTF